MWWFAFEVFDTDFDFSVIPDLFLSCFSNVVNIFSLQFFLFTVCKVSMYILIVGL